MTLTDARKILEQYKADNELVQEALNLVVSRLPVPSNTPTAFERLMDIRNRIKKNNNGYDPFSTRSRTVENSTWRNCVYYQMRNEGYTYDSIGKASGYDHATVVVAYKRLKNYLETRDRYTIRIWNKLQTYLNQ